MKNKIATTSYQQLYQKLTYEQLDVLSEAKRTCYLRCDENANEFLISCYRKWCEELKLPYLTYRMATLHTGYRGVHHVAMYLDMLPSGRELSMEERSAIKSIVRDGQQGYTGWFYRYASIGKERCTMSIVPEKLQHTLNYVWGVAAPAYKTRH